MMPLSFAANLFDSIDDYREWVLLKLFETSNRLIDFARQSKPELDDALETIAQGYARDCAKHLAECGELHRFPRLSDHRLLKCFAITAEIQQAHTELAKIWFGEDRSFVPAAIKIAGSSLSDIAQRLKANAIASPEAFTSPISKSEVRKLYKISETTFKNWLKTGKIPHIDNQKRTIRLELSEYQRLTGT